MRMVTQFAGQSAFGALADGLRSVATVIYRMDESGPTSSLAALRPQAEKALLAIFPDYLKALQEYVEVTLTNVRRAPHAQSFAALEAAAKHARSAAQGGGDASNEHLGELAFGALPRHPKEAKGVVPALRSLMKQVHTAEQVMADAMGQDHGNIPLKERVALLSFDPARVTRADLDSRLDAVEAAVQKGARDFAASLLGTVQSTLPAVTTLSLSNNQVRTVALDQAAFAAQPQHGKAPLSLAEAQALTARAETLQPRVMEGHQLRRLEGLRRTLEKGLGVPQDIEGVAAAMFREASRPEESELRGVAQKLVFDAFMARVASQQAPLEGAVRELNAGTYLTMQNKDAARVVLSLPRTEPPAELATLDGAEKARLDAALAQLHSTVAAGRKQVSAMVTATHAMVSHQYAALQGTREPELTTRLVELSKKTDAMSYIFMLLPRAQIADAEKLTDEIYTRSKRP
jgi:hypothetical protein